MTDRATRRAELLAEVGRGLVAGEVLRAAAWCARVPGRRSAGEVFRAELDPARLLAEVGWGVVGVTAGSGPDVDWYRQARGGVLGGPSGSLAVGLDGILPEPTVPVVLAGTDRRLLVLRRVVARPGPMAGPDGAGLRERLTVAARQVRAAWRGPAPAAPGAAPLELLWQVGRSAVARVDVLPPGLSGRLALLFADGSWIVLGPADDEEARRWVTAFPT